MFAAHIFIPIRYGSYWDVPSEFLTCYMGKVYLFFREDFDDELDDYPPNYKVYICNDISFEDAVKRNCWTPYCFENRTFIGEVPTKDVIFDSSNREFVNTIVFEMIKLPEAENLPKDLKDI